MDRRDFILTAASLPCVVARAAELPSVNRMPRLALVIGNGAYDTAPLRNALNDASGVAQRLKSAQFNIELKLNATKKEMDDAIRAFGQRLRKQKGVGLFYFAGHGAQLSWRNYLIPINAPIGTLAEMQANAVDLATLLDAFEAARSPVNIAILDACRDNPLGVRVQLDQKGFSQVDAPPGTLLAYATAPGNTAADGARGNGLYTEYLLKEMQESAKIEDVLKRVRLGVRRESRGQQIPWESTSLEHDFYFVRPALTWKSQVKDHDPTFAEEASEWDKIARSHDPATFEAYIRRFPSGRFVELAQFRLDQTLAAQGEKRIVALGGSGKNPFSRGTGRVDVNYSVGDEYRYRHINRVSGAERLSTSRVVQVTDTDIVYDNGAFSTDILANPIVTRFGTRERGRQFYVAEYAVSRKWSTRFTGVTSKGAALIIEVELVVVTREPVTTPAGTFNAFKVVGKGTNNFGQDLEYTYWIAPDKVRRPVIYEHVWKSRADVLQSSEREELVAFHQARAPNRGV